MKEKRGRGRPKKLQNTELIEQLHNELKEVVKFNLRAVTESGTQINIRQTQLNDIGYDIVIIPKNRRFAFVDVDLNGKSREVNMYNLITGEFEKTFESTFKAQYHSTEKGFTQANIQECCNGVSCKKVGSKIFLWANESEKRKLTLDFYLDRFGMSREKLVAKMLSKS